MNAYHGGLMRYSLIKQKTPVIFDIFRLGFVYFYWVHMHEMFWSFVGWTAEYIFGDKVRIYLLLYQYGGKLYYLYQSLYRWFFSFTIFSFILAWPICCLIVNSVLFFLVVSIKLVLECLGPILGNPFRLCCNI